MNYSIAKVFLLLFIFLALGCKYPSSLEGTYSTTATTDFVGTNYYFKKDSTFESFGWTCMSRDTGRGHYKLTRDSLIICYDSMDVEKMSRIQVDTLPNAGDSCSLQFYLHDEEGALINAIVMATTVRGTKFGILTDIDGIARTTVHRDSFPVTIEFKYTGYMAVMTRIESPGNLKVSVRMNSLSMHNIAGGTTYPYGLKKLKRGKILLTFIYLDEAGTKQTANWTLYRRSAP